MGLGWRRAEAGGGTGWLKMKWDWDKNKGVIKIRWGFGGMGTERT